MKLTETGPFFVTGATGFVGGSLIRFLIQQGCSVRCLVRKKADGNRLASYGAEVIYGDVLDLDSLKKGVEGASHVFHIAGLVRAFSDADFFKVNEGGCRNIAEACLYEKNRTGRAPVLLAVSSLACCGPGRKASRKEKDRIWIPVAENWIPRPVSPYGRSKYAAEQALTKYADLLPITVVRPPFIFGTCDKLSMPLFEMGANASFFPSAGFRMRYFSFIHVDDLVPLLCVALLNGERLTATSLDPLPNEPDRCTGQGIYLASDPEIVSFAEFGQMIARSFGRKGIFVFRVPPGGVYGGGLIMECVKRMSHRFTSLDWNKAKEAMSGPWISTPEKARIQLGFQCAQSLSERIQQTAQSYLDAGLIVLKKKCKSNSDENGNNSKTN